MIRSLKADGFKSVPYLETSLLMKSHGGVVSFSTDKPNVVVGPNGSGKSALLRALAMHTLSELSGTSVLRDRLVRYEDDLWSKERDSWYAEDLFLKGLQVDSDLPAAMYYRPNHIPGNDDSVSAAMMCGFYDEARSFHNKTHHKSSGQQCSALLEDVLAVIKGEAAVPTRKKAKDWHYKRITENTDRHSLMHMDKRAHTLLELYDNRDAPPAVPVIILDEPEQSLDAMAEIQLWKAIRENDCSRQQIIISTHRLYPIIYSQHFNIIESVPGYVDRLKDHIID